MSEHHVLMASIEDLARKAARCDELEKVLANREDTIQQLRTLLLTRSMSPGQAREYLCTNGWTQDGEMWHAMIDEYAPGSDLLDHVDDIPVRVEIESGAAYFYGFEVGDGGSDGVAGLRHATLMAFVVLAEESEMKDRP